MAPQPTTTSPSSLPPFISHLTTLYNIYIHPHLPPTVQTIIDRSTPMLSSLLSSTLSGDFSSLIMTAVVLYFTLRVADYLRRSVMAWIMFFVKIAILLVLVNVALYVNRVGVQKAYDDGVWLARMAWKAGEEVLGNDTAGTWENVVNRFGGNGAGGLGFGAGNGGGWTQGGRQQVPLGTGERKRRGSGGGSWT
ncbi:hypothetical protein PV10_04626 [Exophiala mesophila]|uniref:Uncharacterized protein n=1 Tax=Exophiala mesophila TaxID=212818 RepID=A0A0D2A305_EXOME|nr:uncharacterized protein PV10_04626 [Exophiala mesophila]KIV93413.1 hypothetical protein PV10_04626 [Exophiala mesophila]